VIIVVEGPDKVGKSTLVAALSKDTGYEVFKTPSDPLHGQDIHDSQAEDAAIMNVLEKTKPDIIFDRYFPSEYAYGIGLARDFSLEAVKSLDRRLAKLDHLCVLVQGEPFAQDEMLSSETWHRVDCAYVEYVEHVSACEWAVTTMPSGRYAVREELERMKEDVELDLSDLFIGLAQCTGRIDGEVLRVDAGQYEFVMNIDKLADTLERIRRAQDLRRR
jgi:hypothetical protein